MVPFTEEKMHGGGVEAFTFVVSVKYEGHVTLGNFYGQLGVDQLQYMQKEHFGCYMSNFSNRVL